MSNSIPKLLAINLYPTCFLSNLTGFYCWYKHALIKNYLIHFLDALKSLFILQINWEALERKFDSKIIFISFNISDWIIKLRRLSCSAIFFQFIILNRETNLCRLWQFDCEEWRLNVCKHPLYNQQHKQLHLSLPTSSSPLMMKISFDPKVSYQLAVAPIMLLKRVAGYSGGPSPQYIKYSVTKVKTFYKIQSVVSAT